MRSLLDGRHFCTPWSSATPTRRSARRKARDIAPTKKARRLAGFFLSGTRGAVAGAGTAFVAVNCLLRYIQTHRFTAFAAYKIALGAVLLLWLPAGG